MTSAGDLYEHLLRARLLLEGARIRRVSGSTATLHALDVRGAGSLPPLVLLHGFSAAAATQYGPLIRLLAPHFSRILAPDLPGHGFSSLPDGGLTGESLVRGFTDALDALLDRPALVFASSMGGAIAVRHARERPLHVRGLILCSPFGAPLPDGDLPAFLRAFRIRGHREALAFVDRVFPRPNALRHLYAWGLRYQFERPHLLALLDQVAGELLRPDELAALTMPILLIWGQKDRLLPPSHRAFFRAHLPPHARFVDPPDFGHAPFLDRSPALADLILDFARTLA